MPALNTHIADKVNRKAREYEDGMMIMEWLYTIIPLLFAVVVFIEFIEWCGL